MEMGLEKEGQSSIPPQILLGGLSRGEDRDYTSESSEGGKLIRPLFPPLLFSDDSPPSLSSHSSRSNSQDSNDDENDYGVLSGITSHLPLLPQYFRLQKTLLNQKPSFSGSSSNESEIEGKDPCQSPAPLEWGELRSASALATPAFEVTPVYLGTPSFENDSTETLKSSTFGMEERGRSSIPK
ncbi:hypothetical protein BDY24DRAFT_11414 [Mrakia frigida]|uniref:uncharacterized protein n=1 Tax=Mrakia frigida TaxID=29902 RepID=UPI003FCC1816